MRTSLLRYHTLQLCQVTLKFILHPYLASTYSQSVNSLDVLTYVTKNVLPPETHEHTSPPQKNIIITQVCKTKCSCNLHLLHYKNTKQKQIHAFICHRRHVNSCNKTVSGQISWPTSYLLWFWIDSQLPKIYLEILKTWTSVLNQTFLLCDVLSN